MTSMAGASSWVMPFTNPPKKPRESTQAWLHLVAVDVRVAAQRRLIVEVVPQHQLIVALAAGGVHGMAAPAVAVGLLEDLAAIVGRMDEVAQIRAGERRMAAMARLAVLVGEGLVVAHVGQMCL